MNQPGRRGPTPIYQVAPEPPSSLALSALRTLRALREKMVFSFCSSISVCAARYSVVPPISSSKISPARSYRGPWSARWRGSAAHEAVLEAGKRYRTAKRYRTPFSFTRDQDYREPAFVAPWATGHLLFGGIEARQTAQGHLQYRSNLTLSLTI